MVSVIFCSQLVFILNIVSSHFVSILLIVRKNKTIFFFITFSSGLQPPKHAVLFYCLKLNLRIYTALNSCSTIWVIFYSCCATYILLIIQTRPKAAQTVYNQQSYARNYNANCSIILFRGYYFYSREFTIYIFFPPLSSYLNRKQTFMKFSYSWNFRRLPLLLLLMKYKIT